MKASLVDRQRADDELGVSFITRITVPPYKVLWRVELQAAVVVQQRSSDGGNDRVNAVPFQFGMHMQ